MVYLKVLLVSFLFGGLCVSLPAAAEYPAESNNELSKQQAVTTVNINTADAKALAAMLKGVGVKRAQAIVDYRESNGPFTDINQLQAIKGISTGIIKKNLDKIRL